MDLTAQHIKSFRLLQVGHRENINRGEVSQINAQKGMRGMASSNVPKPAKGDRDSERNFSATTRATTSRAISGMNSQAITIDTVA